MGFLDAPGAALKHAAIRGGLRAAVVIAIAVVSSAHVGTFDVFFAGSAVAPARSAGGTSTWPVSVSAKPLSCTTSA